MSKVLFVSSEAYPLIKTGGLADVAGSLPRALAKQNQDVRLLLPAYPSVLEKISKPKLVDEQVHYGQVVQLLETRLPGSRVITWLVNCPAAFDRPGTPYADDKGKEWDDNAFRFALFSQVATNIAMGFSQLSWKPDVVHCNDWQSALVPALLSIHKQRPATIFTIHNLSYQGVFEKRHFMICTCLMSYGACMASSFMIRSHLLKVGLSMQIELLPLVPLMQKKYRRQNLVAG